MKVRLLGKIKKTFKDGKKICSENAWQLTCLEYKDSDIFIAHCLEFDLVAQGETKEEARTNLSVLIKDQVDFATDLNAEEKMIFHPAPEKYWKILYALKNRLARKHLLGEKKLTPKSILNRLECVHAA